MPLPRLRPMSGWIATAMIIAALLAAAPALAAAPGETKGPSVVIFLAELTLLMLVGRLLGEGYSASAAKCS